jgi:hypothetical protein
MSEEYINDIALAITTEQIAQARDYADDAYASAQEFLEELKELFEQFEVPTLEIDMPSIEIPDINIELPPELDPLDLELVITGSLPSPPSFNDSEVAGMLDLVFTNINETLQNGGTGITEDVEDAIYDRARSRLDEEFRDESEKLENLYASRGFDVLPGVVAGMMTRLSSEVVRKSADLNNDILVNQTKLAQSQIQFALATCIELFKVRLQEYATRVEAYAAEINGYISGIQAQVAVIEANVKVLQANVTQYVAEVDMQKAYYETLSTKITLELQKAKIESDILISEMDANLKAFVAVKQLQLEAAKAGGSVMAQLAASALSSINTATGYNFHGGITHSDTNNYSEAQSQSEVHQHMYKH